MNLKRIRPTAEDRNLANILRQLKPGNYSISVEDNYAGTMRFLGPAKLKREGSIEITFDKTTVLICPV